MNDERVRRMMRAAMKRVRVVRVMVTTKRVAHNKEDDRNSHKSNGNDGGKSDGTEGGRRATVTVPTWAMATAMRFGGNEEGKCKGGKGNGDSNEGGQQWQQRLKPFQWWQQRQQRLWRWQTTTETAGAGNNQQNAVGGSGSGRDNSRGSSKRFSVAAMAGRGGGTAE
jgi:hypothetical protein